MNRSNKTHVVLGPSLEPVVQRSIHAALDSDDNIAFLTDILMDHGVFIGERPGPDDDGDGVTNVDDNCPNIANPEHREPRST